VLNSHSRIAIPFESHLYNKVHPWLSYYGDLEQEENRLRLIDDILRTPMVKQWKPIAGICCNKFGGMIFTALSVH
jgi:hypothetical protein